MNPKVDTFLSKADQWQEEMAELRTILLDCDLTEEWKWRSPCYTFQGSNIAIIGGFKTHCVLSFFKGALLQNPEGILEKPGENIQAARVIRFTNSKEITAKKSTLEAYIFEAIEVEKAGLRIDFKEKNELVLVEELLHKFEELPAFKTAFEALTPGRQRGYNLFFSAGKQSQTRTARIEKYIERILDGKGINDCVCGLSNKMPSCDGSHKYI
ncbi:DUF1801 domain-containing protein [Lewinella sp. LCG006]|uniref:DUF1801 domain-containing protein n=1 Tax=Lewinella sp. LCG006 TaxID=3231911 RepID=UPI00346113F9